MYIVQVTITVQRLAKAGQNASGVGVGQVREGMKSMSLLRNVRSVQSRARAFTLIELLVVIAIIALLVGILLPALKEARKAGQSLQSAANLAGLGKAVYAYANDYRDVFVNPFPADGVQQVQGAAPAGWDWYYAPDTGYALRPGGDGTRFSEPFAFYWTVMLSSYMGATTLNSSEATVAKYDKEAFDRSKAIAAFNNGAPPNERRQPDSSYIYSPTFWTASDRYVSATVLPALSNNATSARRYLRHNRLDQVTMSSAKALCWERGDFLKPSRATLAGGRIRISPSWLSPEADPQVCFVDGSVAKVRMVTIHKLGNPALNTNTDELSVFQPTTNFNLQNGLLPDQLTPTDSPAGDDRDDIWENGQGLKNGGGATKIYQQYFWGTRNGIRGRDVPR